MKILIALIFIYLFLPLETYSQWISIYGENVSKEKIHARITFPDTTNNAFFRAHPEIKQIWVAYKGGKPMHVLPLTERYRGGHIEGMLYDLEYEGDSFVLATNYRPINLVTPRIEIMPLRTDKDSGERYDILDAYICKDSVLFEYKQRLLLIDEDHVNTDRVIGWPAKWSGDLDRLSKDIARAYAEAVNKSSIDSVVVLLCKVDRKGFTQEVQLEAGEPSFFSDLVQDYLSTPTAQGLRQWKPAIIYTSGQSVISHVRVYAKLNRDGSVHLSTTPKLYRFLPK